MNEDYKTFLRADDEITALELIEYIVINVTDALMHLAGEIVSSVHFLLVLIFVFCVVAGLKIKNGFTEQ